MLKKVRILIGKPFRWFKNTSRKKKIITIIVGVILLFILIGQISNSTKPPPYTLAKVERGNIDEIVSETGNIITNNSTEIYSPTNGIIEEIYVSNGDSVTEGQELFRVKSTATEQETQQAYANYLAAVAALNAARSTADLYRSEMYGRWKAYTDLSTSSQYETEDGHAKQQEREAAEFQIAQDTWKAAEAQYKDQETAIAQAQASVHSASLLYQATQNATVKAPSSGVVSNRSISEGMAVKIPAQSLTQTPPVPALTLVTQSKTEAMISLSESDAIKVQPGQEVSLEVNAIDDTTFRGRVVRVDDIGSNTQGVVQYNAYVELLTNDSKVKPGMTVDVTVTTKKVRDVLSVPNAAVKPYKGGRAVRIVDPETKEPKYIPVEIGVKGESRTEIRKGLTEGQEVITALANDQIKRSSMF